jgi:hypothetical protein
VSLRIALAGVAAVVLVASACGGHGAQRKAVTAYIQQVNGIQIAMRAPLTSVEKAYKAFGRKNGPTLAQIEPRLVRAELTIRRIGKRLRALHPPPDAQKLHRLLVRLVTQEAEVAHEVVLLAQFSPRFTAALGPLGPASEQLQTSFKHAKKAKDQADALDAYAVSVGGVLTKLRAVKAPPAFVPTLESQRSTLERVRATALDLATGLRKNKQAALPTLIQRFTNAGRAGQGLAAQKARIAAIKAYNARIAGLAALAGRISTERSRIDTRLG